MEPEGLGGTSSEHAGQEEQTESPEEAAQVRCSVDVGRTGCGHYWPCGQALGLTSCAMFFPSYNTVVRHTTGYKANQCRCGQRCFFAHVLTSFRLRASWSMLSFEIADLGETPPASKGVQGRA